MAVQHEVALTALREIRRNLRSTKGIAMFALFFLGGAVPSVLSVLYARAAKGAGIDQASEEVQKGMRERLLAAAYGGSEEVAKYLVECPPVIFFLLKGTLFFLPLLVLLVGFDQIAGEIQHRSIRYVAGRARRSSIVIGKALGVWAVVGIMCLVLHLTVWTVMLVRGETPASDTLSWGLRVWLFCIAFAGAQVGFTTLVSSLFRTPIVALFIGAGLAFFLWLTNMVLGIWEKTESLTWAFPSTYENWMVSPDPSKAVGGMLLCIAWGALMVAGASAVVRRRDV